MINIQNQLSKFLQSAVENEYELGVQLVVYLKGKKIVDIYEGFTDIEKHKKVTSKTLFPVFSVGKGFTSTIVHIMAAEGKLNYDDPISKYWPEFGVNKKNNITIRQILNHTAGLYNMPRNLNPKAISNWSLMVTKIQNMRPASKPGDLYIYHAITFSWLIGELLQKIENKTFRQLLNEKLSKPLGLQNLYIGIPPKLHLLIAKLYEPDPNLNMLHTKEPQPVPAWICPLVDWMNTKHAQLACLPSSNCITNAESIARHYAALLPKGVDGIQLIPYHQLCKATKKQKLNNGISIHRGLGYVLGGEKKSIYGSRCQSFGHAGYGGSFGFADPKYELAIGFTKNKFSSNGITYNTVQKVRELLKIPN